MALRHLPELQEFRFVDRKGELVHLSNFAARTLGDTESNLMWVRGASQVGVSRFLQEAEAVLSAKPGMAAIRVKMDDAQNADERALGTLLDKLGAGSDGVLGELAVRYSPGAAFSTISSTAPQSPTAFGVAALVEAVLAGVMLTSEGRARDPYQIICDLLERFVGSNRCRLVLIVDQLHNAQSNFFECMANVMSELSGADEVRFVISSSIGFESDRFKEKLTSRFEIAKLDMGPFDSSVYFYDILTDFFEDISPGDESVKRLGDLCGLNAGMLRNSLREFYMSDVCNDSIASFSSFVREYRKSSLDVFEDAFMQVMSHIGEPISEPRTMELVQTIVSTAFMLPDASIVAPKLYEARMALGKSGLLTRVLEPESGHGCLIAVNRPALSCVGGVCTDPNMKQRIFDVIRAMDPNDWAETFPRSNRQDMEARLSYDAKDQSACELNYSYALQLIGAGRSLDALPAIERYLDTNPVPNPDEYDAITDFARICYLDGRYIKAKRLLELIGTDCGTRFERAYLRGKVSNVLHDFEDAETYLRLAEDISRCNDEAISAKSMRQLILAEKPHRFEEARQIFKELYKSAESKATWSTAECMAMRTVVDFPRDDFDIDAILSKAYRCAGAQSNRLPLAYLCVARGLQSMRGEDMDEAFSLFDESRTILSTLRPHEQAYTLNNMGLCKMIEGDQAEAVVLLRQGLSWGASPYIRITLMSNLAVALSLQKRQDALANLLPSMEDALDSPSSLVRNRVSHAICFTLLATGEPLHRFSANRHAALFSTCLENLADTPADDKPKRARVEAYSAWRDHSGVEFLLYCDSRERTYYGVAFQPWVSTLHHD